MAVQGAPEHPSPRRVGSQVDTIRFGTHPPRRIISQQRTDIRHRGTRIIILTLFTLSGFAAGETSPFAVFTEGFRHIAHYVTASHAQSPEVMSSATASDPGTPADTPHRDPTDDDHKTCGAHICFHIVIAREVVVPPAGSAVETAPIRARIDSPSHLFASRLDRPPKAFA